MVQKESSGLTELAIGGLMYAVGVIFFKSDGIVPFAHAIWHSFVFIGASFHFVAVCRHLLVDPSSLSSSMLVGGSVDGGPEIPGQQSVQTHF